MTAARIVALRVNGLRATKAAVRPSEKGPELIVTVRMKSPATHIFADTVRLTKSFGCGVHRPMSSSFLDERMPQPSQKAANGRDPSMVLPLDQKQHSPQDDGASQHSRWE